MNDAKLRHQADRDRAASTAAQLEVNSLLKIKIGGMDGRQEQLIGIVGELMAEISKMKKQIKELTTKEK